MSHDFNRRAGKSAEFSLKTVRILAVVLVFIRGSQTQDLASVSSVRTTEFEVRNLNTVVRFHYTSLHGRLPKSGYKGAVLKTVRSVKRHVGSNPTSSFCILKSNRV